MSPPIETQLRDLRSQRTVLASGQYLFHQGDPIRAIHVVQAGCIHLIRHQNDGDELILQKGGPGSIVAEAALYSERYHCDALAAGSAQVLAFAKSEIRRRLRADPDFAEAWARHLAHELQKARLHAEILSLKTVAKRLDAWLAWHAGDAPGRGDGKIIAREIGVSPEALYREMAKRRAQQALT